MKLNHIKQVLVESFDWDSLQYKYVKNEDTNEHRLNFFNKAGAVGYIEWDMDDGEIGKIFVGTPYRRLGVATHMWETAQEWADEHNETPPEHSSRRTKEGDAWAQSVGGRVPDLTDDIDGWTSR